MDPTAHAMMAFRYREEATGRKLPCDPDWVRVMREGLRPALLGERGDTDQQQCVYQAIRVATWESGVVSLPWSKAFLPVPLPVVWYKRWWNKATSWCRSLLKRFNDFV